MKLAFNFQAAGVTAESIDTQAVVVLDNGAIGQIELTTKVKIAGLSQEKFDEFVADAWDRRIEADVGGNDIRLSDRVVNAGFLPTPHMLFYHVNIGHPVVEEGLSASVTKRPAPHNS